MEDQDFVVADMHDGDQKRITFGKFTYLEGLSDGFVPMTIRPHGNDQTWEVHADMHFNQEYATAIVDFNVDGKPSPPPCNLTVSLWREVAGFSMNGARKRTLEFTDPTGTITKDPQFPLNTWVELPTKP